MTKHVFVPKSFTDLLICKVCNREIIMHGPNATCDACHVVGHCEPFGSADMFLCAECTAKEIAANDAIITRTKIAQAVSAAGPNDIQHLNELTKLTPAQMIEKSKEIDQSIKVREDIYNVEAIAIEDLRKAVYADASIPQDDKAVVFYRLLEDKRLAYQRNCIERRIEQEKDNTRQRAIQQTLNVLVNTLRLDQREKIAAKSPIVYPSVPQPVGKVKQPKVRLSLAEKNIANLAKLYNIPLEQAAVIYTSDMAKLGIKCSCAITPGICKLHYPDTPKTEYGKTGKGETVN